MVDIVLGLAIGMGIIYALGSIVMAFALATERYRGFTLLFFSFVWIPLLLLVMLHVMFSSLRITSPTEISIGKKEARMRLIAPSFRRWGFAFISLQKKKMEE